ncbi:hypothetical protein CRUP_014304 [Coryphaenoides rupestris]|nr:hypothetical protein CRUP_014304 [Coryphaenoides rupestris]
MGLGRLAVSASRLCHCCGRPVNFCSRASKPVCTRCSKLDGAEISRRFFFLPNMLETPGQIWAGKNAQSPVAMAAAAAAAVAAAGALAPVLAVKGGHSHLAAYAKAPAPPPLIALGWREFYFSSSSSSSSSLSRRRVMVGAQRGAGAELRTAVAAVSWRREGLGRPWTRQPGPGSEWTGGPGVAPGSGRTGQGPTARKNRVTEVAYHHRQVQVQVQTIVRGSRPPKDASINGLLEDFDNISVTRSNSLRKESPTGPHQAGGGIGGGGGGGAGVGGGAGGSKPGGGGVVGGGGVGSRLNAPEENGFSHYYSRYSCDIDTSGRDFTLEPGKLGFSMDGDWPLGRHYRLPKQNGHSHPHSHPHSLSHHHHLQHQHQQQQQQQQHLHHLQHHHHLAVRSPFYPDAMPQRADYAKLPPDYHAYLESKGRPPVAAGADEVASTVGSGVGSSGYYRASVGGSSSQDYRDTSVGTPSRASLHSEQINYPDSEWSYGGVGGVGSSVGGGGGASGGGGGGGSVDYDKRPKSSYVAQTSPTPAIRQRSRSGSGLQEPSVLYGGPAGGFKGPPQAHSYSS